MGERKRRGPFNQEPTHGAISRASRPVPANLRNVHQGYEDKVAMRELLQRREEARKKELYGLGNRDLPAHKHKQEIVEIVDRYRASIIGGATGSGKSTQVPQFLYEAGYDKIYVMVPRRVIADNLFDRVKEEMSWHLGTEEATQAIGLMHGERTEVSDENRIVIMTPNTFLRAGNDIERNHADKKVAIVADEMHEANVYTEIAAGVGLRAVENNENWRFVAMSATHNEAVLQGPLSAVNNGITPSLKIEGRPFELEQHERPKKTAMEVYAEECGDAEKAMIFTSGKAEIDHIIERTRLHLDLQNPGSSRKVVFRKLHSELTDREIGHLNDPVPDDCRLVIVSSPAGMSGITIPGVTHVISDGTINREELDDDDNPGLSREYLSQAGVIQQFGRAGRDVPGGIGYLAKPTMVEEDKMMDRGMVVDVQAMPYKPYNQRKEFEPAEIYHSLLSGIVLSVANLDMKFADVNEYLPHRVESTAIIKAEQHLMRLGSLGTEGGEITDIGRQMSEYQIRPELSRGIVEAMRGNRPLLHMARAAIIAAAVGAGGVQDFSDKRSKEWRVLLDDATQDDMTAQYDIITALPSGDVDRDIAFIEEHDLSYKRIKQAQKVARKIMRTLGIQPHNVVHAPMNLEEVQAIHDDLAAGMIDSIYEYVGTDRNKSYYRNIHAGDPNQQRTLSDRSITTKKTRYIAGFPRWFKKINREGEQVKYDIVEQTMPVSPDVIGKYAAQADLLEYEHVGLVSDKGMVKELVQPKFGSINVGAKEQHMLDQAIPEIAQAFLFDRVLNNQGYNQKGFRALVKELERYRNAVPEESLRGRLKSDAPSEMITQKAVDNLIKLYAERTVSENEIDQLLGAHMYSKNVGIDQYFTQEDREWLQACSVPDIVLDDEYYLKVQYLGDKNKTPYMTIPPRQRQVLAKIRQMDISELTLPDGRVLHIKHGKQYLHPHADPNDA